MKESILLLLFTITITSAGILPRARLRHSNARFSAHPAYRFRIHSPQTDARRSLRNDYYLIPLPIKQRELSSWFTDVKGTDANRFDKSAQLKSREKTHRSLFDKDGVLYLTNPKPKSDGNSNLNKLLAKVVYFGLQSPKSRDVNVFTRGELEKLQAIVRGQATEGAKKHALEEHGDKYPKDPNPRIEYAFSDLVV